MLCSISDLKNKQLVSTETGELLGFVGDVEIDSENGSIKNLLVYGKIRGMGFLGREDDLLVPWESIEVIGEETILVKGAITFKKTKRKIF